MDNKNNELNENDKKPVDKNKMAKVLSSIAFLAILFCGAYFITDYVNNLDKNTFEGEGEDKVVLNQTPQALKDDTVVILKTKDIVDAEKKLSELKNDLQLTGSITKESLEKALKGKGYVIGEIEEDKLVFNRESEHVLIPNKFYLGEKDGQLAIFKTNEAGEAKDIYIDEVPINILPKENQEKLRSFEKYYDTEEEARMRLTAYTS